MDVYCRGCFTDRVRRQWIGVWLLVATAVSYGQALPAAEPSRSRFFYNDDGDRTVFLLKGPFQRRQLHYPVDVLVGTGVTTLVFCANMGSDQAYYPSQVASSLGWREVENTRRNARYTYFNRLREIGEMLRKEKIDLLGIVMRRAQQQGLEFVPSLRMNDTHFLNKEPPRVHPLTGEFWMKNQDLTINGGALDFSHQKVRDYRLGQIRELIAGYATDGFEMDFSRQPTLFPTGTGRDNSGLVTEMVRQARRWLDARSQGDDHRRFLIVRVPHTLDLCQHYGFDLGGWMKENLVDYVVPASPDRYFQFDIPLGDFLDLARRTDSTCRVIAGPDSYRATPSMYRAGMSNYYTMGQRDTYLFNFFAARAEPRNYYPFGDEDYALLRDLKSPVTLWGRPKHFMSAGWFPGRGLKLAAAGQPYHVDLYVGDDLPLARRENILKTARLQMAVHGLPAEASLEVRLNDQLLPPASAQRDADQFQFPLIHMLPVQGPNRVSVTASRIDATAPPTMTRVEMFVDYDLLGVVSDPSAASQSGP